MARRNRNISRRKCRSLHKTKRTTIKQRKIRGGGEEKSKVLCNYTDTPFKTLIDELIRDKTLDDESIISKILIQYPRSVDNGRIEKYYGCVQHGIRSKIQTLTNTHDVRTLMQTLEDSEEDVVLPESYTKQLRNGLLKNNSQNTGKSLLPLKK
jgi:hypothetical protein